MIALKCLFTNLHRNCLIAIYLKLLNLRDKGLQVILDNDDYITETHDQIFNDNKYYMPLEGPVYLNTCTIDEVNSILDKSYMPQWKAR